MLDLMVSTPPNPMPHALDTLLWATVTYLYTEVENAPANKIRLMMRRICARGSGTGLGRGSDWGGSARTLSASSSETDQGQVPRHKACARAAGTESGVAQVACDERMSAGTPFAPHRASRALVDISERPVRADVPLVVQGLNLHLLCA